MEQFLDAMPELELQVDFESSGNQKHFSINSAYLSFGKESCFDSPLLHCFTGADATS